MRTITVRECSCAEPNACSQACGSAMVDRLYVEATEVERLREAIRVALERDHDAMDSWCRQHLADALGREDRC